MKCYRCGKDEHFTDLVPISARYLKPELGYRDMLGGGKNAFCEECVPKVSRRVKKESKRHELQG